MCSGNKKYKLLQLRKHDLQSCIVCIPMVSTYYFGDNHSESVEIADIYMVELKKTVTGFNNRLSLIQGDIKKCGHSPCGHSAPEPAMARSGDKVSLVVLGFTRFTPGVRWFKKKIGETLSLLLAMVRNVLTF